ncbi:ArsR/SmtB family transcription factor [Embleya sp. NPDC050154]|uniref:ArsR/SmtB family transcription factor n=1 Tax=Embleya sp. NPDC050154 TaxID=3363988 RepID=UPI0037B9A93B
MAPEARRRIGDADTLRALAGPVRQRLLTHLMTFGPQTATQCASVVEATPSNCSYHLRELARYGLVERVEASAGDARERLWRATVTGLIYDPPTDADADPVVALARREVAHVRIDNDAALAHAAVDRHEELPPHWRDAETMAGYGLRVTAAELAELTAAIDALLRPYIAPTREDAPEDARVVHLGLTALRTSEPPT